MGNKMADKTYLTLINVSGTLFPAKEKVQRGILKVCKVMSDVKVENGKKVFTFSSDTEGKGH